jgi:hypothetical protein
VGKGIDAAGADRVGLGRIACPRQAAGGSCSPTVASRSQGRWDSFRPCICLWFAWFASEPDNKIVWLHAGVPVIAFY